MFNFSHNIRINISVYDDLHVSSPVVPKLKHSVVGYAASSCIFYLQQFFICSVPQALIGGILRVHSSETNA